MYVLTHYVQNFVMIYLCSSASVIANGPTTVASGTTIGVNPSSSTVGGEGSCPSSVGNNNLGSALPSNSSNKGTTIAFGGGSMPFFSNCYGSIYASSSVLCFSSSDQVLVPSNDLQFPGAVGAIRREVGSQRPPSEFSATNLTDIKSTAG